MQQTHSLPEPARSARQGAEAFARAIVLIFTPLLQLIANRAPSLGVLTWPLHTRITRARNRLVRLLAALAAGRLPRLRAPGNARPGGTPPLNIPRRPLWLVATLGYQAAGYGSQLQHLLNDPATLATLAAAPPRTLAAAARTLRPLCRILGVTLPAILQPPPASLRRKPAKPPRLKPAPLPPLLPLYPQRRPRPLPFMNFGKKLPPA